MLTVTRPILYDFTEYGTTTAFVLEQELSSTDLADMKFAFIEFLYYFLREDVERVKKAEAARSKRKHKLKNSKRSKKAKLDPMFSKSVEGKGKTMDLASTQEMDDEESV